MFSKLKFEFWDRTFEEPKLITVFNGPQNSVHLYSTSVLTSLISGCGVQRLNLDKWNTQSGFYRTGKEFLSQMGHKMIIIMTTLNYLLCTVRLLQNSDKGENQLKYQTKRLQKIDYLLLIFLSFIKIEIAHSRILDTFSH